PGVDAVDARPRFAAVGRFVDAAVLEGIGALLVLDVFALATVPEAIGAFWISAGAGFQSQREFLDFFAALDFERDFISAQVPAEDLEDLPQFLGGFAVERHEHVIGLDAGFHSGSVLSDFRHLDAAFDFLAGQAEIDASGGTGAVFQCHRDVHHFFAALDFDRDLVAGFVLANLLDQRVVGLDLGFVELLDDIASLEAGLGRGAVADHARELGAAVAVLALHAEEGLRRRSAHADSFAVDDGVDGIRILAVVIEAGAAECDGGQALGDLVPGLAAIGGFVDAAARAPFFDGVVPVVAFGGRHLGARMAIEAVALAFPGSDKKRLGIGRVHLQVDDAGLVVDGEDLVPRLAAVGGLIQAALLIRSP